MAKSKKINWNGTNIAPEGEPAAEALVESVRAWLKKYCLGAHSNEPWDLADIAYDVVIEVANQEGMLQRANSLLFRKKK